MSIPVIMPKQGQSVETCIITRWFKNTGDRVSAGDILFSYETDKAAFDMESPGDGILLEVFFSEGDEVPVLMNVAVIGEKGESTESFNPLKELKRVITSTSQTEKIAETSTDSEQGSEKIIPVTDPRIRISPRARHIAEDSNLNYSNLKGSGPNGRIIVSDIEKALSGAKAEDKITVSREIEFTEQPLSNVRKLIARAMYTSLQSSAQLTHHMSADVRRLLEARRKIKEGIASGYVKQDITLNDMICWCVIRALEKHPEINSHLLDNSIKKFNTVHLGIAVDTPRGLMVPTVRNAERMDLEQLSLELRSGAEACRKGNISPELIQSTSASFTVSNLGSYGVEMFTPVINLPQTGILGICSIISRPADLGNNTFGFIPFIGLSLTYDHRAIDGGPATLFLKEIKKQIEGFEG
ncbi:MAG: 2-oxo acid dehydrogenase subunit E2 [Bacteroidales bacterium]|nr:2-oxo acid dehydrogenase subunit E2 [Bacteroidales bacterium]